MGLLIGAPSAFAIAHLSPPDAMGSTAEHAALARLRDPPESESSTTRPSAAPPVTFDRAPGGLVDGSGESGDRVEQGGWCCGGVAEAQVRAGGLGWEVAAPGADGNPVLVGGVDGGGFVGALREPQPQVHPAGGYEVELAFG